MSHGMGVSGSQLSLLPDEDVIDAAACVNTRRIPVEADFLFAYSTVPGKSVFSNLKIVAFPLNSLSPFLI